MKKKLSILLLLCGVCAALVLVTCGIFGGKKHTHSYVKTVTTDAYLCSSATCTKKATYYYSCECGERSTDTFEYGAPLGHSFTNYVSDNNATCTKDGTKTAKCDRCSERDTITDENTKLGHSFTNYVSDNNANYKNDGTKTAHCDHSGCTATDTVPDDGSKLESKISFKTLSVGEKKDDGSILVYGKVPNEQKTYSFIDEIETAGNIQYIVSLDIYGIQQVATKTIPLTVGDNVVYITELFDGEPQAVYEVAVRRRPTYRVEFKVNGGTAVAGQTIEEDSIISEPSTTRVGYTFVNWDYDFSQPITEDMTISANWTANTDTAYKVEYYFENIEDTDYTLLETDDLQGTTDTTATAEIKTFEHFTFNKDESALSGNVAGDGSLVLKVYYTRNTYTLSNENSSYGEITNVTTRKYGNDKIESVATEYLGCEFVGWYNGKELLSTANDYTFTIEFNVTAKFKVKDEVSNFDFNSSVNDCTITGVKDKTVSKIIIPDNVSSIKTGAFRGCSSLERITLPFIGASKTANSGYDEVFGYIFGYTTTNSFGGTLQYSNGGIDYFFYIPESLKTVILSDSVTSIGKYAFYNCSGFTSVTIGSSVTDIGSWAFDGCSDLERVIWNAENCTTAYSIFNKDCSKLATVIIGDDVKTMPAYAFDGCSGLTSVYYLGTIDQWAEISFKTADSNPLRYAKKLYTNNELVTEANLTAAKKISAYAFYDYSGLTSVTIGSRVTYIGSYAFYNCSGLTSINVSSDNTKYHSENNCIIETNTNTLIQGCVNSTIPDSVTSIGAYAFSVCSGLTSITIPDSVTEIGSSAFYNCSGLKSVNYLGTIDKWVEINFYDYDSNPLYYAEKLYINNELVTEVNITTATKISNSAFYNCSGLTSVTIGNSVTSIGDYAFCGCSGLTSVTIPDSVTSIGSAAFYNCSGLTSVMIPDNVTSIKIGAFRGCSSLERITLPFIGASKTAYRGYDEVFGYIFGYTTTNSFGGTLQYSNGRIDYFFYIPRSLKTVILSDSVTSIGDYAFSDCSGLTSVTIGSRVTSIGRNAFDYCSRLTSVYYLGTIDQWAEIRFKTAFSNPLWYAKKLYINNELVIEANLTAATKISAYAFSGCNKLTSITIPDSVTSIGDYAFDGCYKLVEVINHSNLKIVKGSSDYGNVAYYALNVKTSAESEVINQDGYLFYTYDGNDYLFGYIGTDTELVLPDSYNGKSYAIYERAFYNCRNLTSITIPDSVTSIGDYAFAYCSGLTSVTIPDSVTSIGNSAFSDCSGLRQVFYKGSEQQWNKISIGWNNDYLTKATRYY